MIEVIQATHALHASIVAVSKTTRWTRDFTNQMFSSPERYAEGTVYAACVSDGGLHGPVVGFACVRHLKRRPETNVYFVGVAPEWRSLGVGEQLLRRIAADSPHKNVILKVAQDNTHARSFYERMGFIVRDSDDESYWHMVTDTKSLTMRTKS